MKRLSNLKALFVATFAVMVAALLVPVLTLRQVAEAHEGLIRAERDRKVLHDVVECLTDAESAARGYIITGRSGLLERYYRARGQLKLALSETGSAAANDLALTSQWREALPLIDSRVAALEGQVVARQGRGATEAGDIMRRGESDRDLDRLDAVLGQLSELAQQRTGEASGKVARLTRLSLVATSATQLAFAGLLFGVFRQVYRRYREVERAAADQRTAMQGLEGGLEELELRNRQISLLTELAVGLEAPSSIEEGMRTIGLFGTQLFPGTSAAVFLVKPSLDILERSATWGEPRGPDVLDPTSCWALRRGQLHAVHSADHDLICPHSADAPGEALPRLCLPLAAHGDALGLICVHADGSGAWKADDRMLALARAFSEQVSLGLSSFALRETLRRQSVVDSLTGLYNRRYLDDALRREVFQAQRREKALSVIMVDADHFKRINDIFGHDAGDVVLRAIGRELKAAVRGGDLACRFGGEEFALVLTDCGKPQAIEKAGRVAELIRGLHLVHGVTTLPPLTISAGVATYPEDGQDAERLIAAADRALYAAKRGGRDRVEAAHGPEGDPIELPHRRF